MMGPASGSRHDEVHAAPMQLDAFGDGPPMRVEAPERGQQGRVDIQQPS